MRPKDDADKLKRDRKERRQLIEDIADSDFDEVSEVTQPNIHLTLQQHPPPQPPPPPPSPTRSTLASSETVLSTLDKLPAHHRIWAVLAIILAVVGLIIAGKYAL